MFIGREEELQFLENCYQSEKGQLLVLYGRRRVGKTETLRHFCTDKPHVFFSCTEVADAQQLSAFSERLLQTGLPAARYISRFADWTQALSSISELPFSTKKLVVIDEFPHMVKGNSAVPSILQNLWDTKLKDENVMIILCGSSMSFMEKEILSEKNPLYGRATGILKMNAMGFYDAIRFFPEWEPEDLITAYAVLGGIPHYLKQFDGQLSLEENICRHILTRGSILYSEVEFLMRQELRESAIYNTIIAAVALGNTKLNDIFQKTQIEKSKLSVYLKNLIDLGILYREFSMADQIREQANVQRGLYQISDNFFRFWYAFVFPNLSELESGDAKGIWKHVIQPELDRYTSFAFEDICRQYLRRENRRNALPFYFTKIGRWWSKTEELDILATDHAKSAFLIGECKYRNTPFALSDLRKMQSKFFPEKPEAQLYYYLFSKNGFTEDVRSAAGTNIFTITAKELI